MVDAEVSGVMFTCNPVSGDPSMVAINASWGLGLAVVGGEVTPDDYLVSKVTGEVVREQVNDKAIQYVPRPDGRGAHAGRGGARPPRGPLPRRGRRCRRWWRSARRVERHFGSHQDIEWAIARDGTARERVRRPVAPGDRGRQGPDEAQRPAAVGALAGHEHSSAPQAPARSPEGTADA